MTKTNKFAPSLHKGPGKDDSFLQKAVPKAHRTTFLHSIKQKSFYRPTDIIEAFFRTGMPGKRPLKS